MTTPIVEFRDVSLGYGRRLALTDLNLRVQRGDFLGVVGPNGAGKTTLLKAILGMLLPTKGVIERDNSLRFGYVPQQQRLDDIFPLNVMDVVMMGRYPLMGVFGRPRGQDRQIAMRCLEHSGISDLALRPFKELSGGQKQRALIARALAGEPLALILDEPTNDMDIGSEYAIMELIRRLHEEEGITIVMVSHLLNVVGNYAGSIAIIEDGIARIGSADSMISPENLKAIYGVPIAVSLCSGKRIALAGGEDV